MASFSIYGNVVEYSIWSTPLCSDVLEQNTVVCDSVLLYISCRVSVAFSGLCLCLMVIRLSEESNMAQGIFSHFTGQVSRDQHYNHCTSCQTISDKARLSVRFVNSAILVKKALNAHPNRSLTYQILLYIEHIQICNKTKSISYLLTLIQTTHMSLQNENYNIKNTIENDSINIVGL